MCTDEEMRELNKVRSSELPAIDRRVFVVFFPFFFKKQWQFCSMTEVVPAHTLVPLNNGILFTEIFTVLGFVLMRSVWNKLRWLKWSFKCSRNCFHSKCMFFWIYYDIFSNDYFSRKANKIFDFKSLKTEVWKNTLSWPDASKVAQHRYIVRCNEWMLLL